MARRLAPHYPVLYTGRGGLVAHECIVDLRQITKETGVTVDDVAKRLDRLRLPRADHVLPGGRHADDRADRERGPGRARPVLRGDDRHPRGDRRGRRRRVAADDNPLRNAPHTADSLVAGEWDHPYGRTEAAYPLPSVREDKYWPPVRRIDQAYGDRNLVCTCPPLEAYED